MKKAVIVGGGFTGCTMARLLRNKGFDVTLVEGSDGLGGGCRTFFYHGHPYTIGPHHLIIDKEDREAYGHFDRIVPLRRLSHHVLSYGWNDDRFYSYPPHLDEVPLMPERERILREVEARDPGAEVRKFEEYWVNSIGPTLYDKFVNHYSKKMWRIDDNRAIDEFPVLKKKIPLRTERCDYFEDTKIIAYPVAPDGYNRYFDFCTEGCRVILNTRVDRFDLDRKGVLADGEWIRGDLLVSTTSLDRLLDCTYGELKYMGRDFLKLILPVERITPEPYYFLYYAGDEPYTRVVEYKLLTGHKAPDTMIGIEFPSDRNRMYPYPMKSETDKARRYLDALPDGVFSLGRLGQYRYLDMYVILKDALRLVSEL
jgi:UDP-galactopyranose mutase